MKSSINISKCTKLPPVKCEGNPKFGTQLAPHYLRVDIVDGEPHDAAILQYGPTNLGPAASVLHYGQSIFEGMKAYRQKDGSVGIFRMDLHSQRFQKSAEKMAMVSFSPELFEFCLKAYVDFESESVPSAEDTSLYLRPLLFANDEVIKLGPGKRFTFLIMSSLAGRYFTDGEIKPAKVLVNKEFVRAFPGGTGEAKTAGNYAASLAPQAHAMKLGADQVLYLDAREHKYIDELGGMNFFVIKGNELITPKLNGAILNGVTRRSILELAPAFGLNPKEEPIEFEKLMSEIESGKIDEVFACGTAVTVCPLGQFMIQENSNDSIRLVELKSDFSKTKSILNRLSQIQRGVEPAPGDWIFKV
ncbi:MAG: branched-chain amino acid aminotransferase [Bdellovibrionales bacterium]|nr:branched-chain amino acid aminotransferase [Bdellovibrionales bacterium]